MDKSFVLFRKDRDNLTSDRKRGGGVLIAVKRSITAELIETNDSDIEQIFIRVRCTENDIIIGCVYLPPLSPLDTYINHTDTVLFLKNKYPNCKIIILGDYNLPSSYPQASCENTLFSEMILVNCQQFNTIYNNNNKILDLCFSDTDVKVNKADPLISEDNYHPALNILVNIQANLKQNNSRKLLFNKANYAGLNEYYMSCNWVELFEIEALDDKINWFYNKLNEGIALYVPVHHKRPNNYPTWFSNELIKKIKEKKSAHTKYKKTNSKYHYNTFRKLRQECKIISNNCYNNYIIKTEQMIKLNATGFWSFIKNKRRSDNDIPSTMNWNDTIANDGQEVSNLFASFFKNTFQPVTPYLPNTISGQTAINHSSISEQDVNLSKLNVRYDDVYKQLRKLDSRKGAGPDELPNQFLKNCAAGLAEPITHLFSTSLESGMFPSAWKASFISPIHKSGPKGEVSNYRPVCIQSSLSKLFEKIVLPQITSAFQNVISTRQHGFVGGRSTTTNLYLYTNYVLDAMNQGLCTHAIYTDFSKAFDTVDHETLLDKLYQYGVRDKALDWIRSYLSDRRLQVRVNGHISNEYYATTGVPQGSHLGPILFIIFINDIGEKFESEYLLYADDLKIYRRINDVEDMNSLQRDLNELHNWCAMNKLNLNKSKCVTLCLSRGNSQYPPIYNLDQYQLTDVSSVKDLGIIIDNKLNFTEHIDKITSKAFKTLGFILRTGREFNDVHTNLHLFNTLVRPILEYCSIIWSPHTQVQINRVERIQKKFCKFITYYLYTRGSYMTTEEVYNKFKINSLLSRRHAADMMFFYKVINGLILSPEIHEQFEFTKPRPGLRNTRLLITTKTSRSYVYHGPRNRISNLVNEHCSSINFLEDSMGTFYSKLNNILLMN